MPETGSGAVIETRELTKIYGRQVAVNHLSLRIEEGEIFGFLGPNGAGKTTTLLMLLGLTEPTSGRVRVLGFNPTREPIKVKRQAGYLQENMGFYRDLNAGQMLDFVAELNGLPKREAQGRIAAALRTVGLADDARKKIGAYSRGMRQRLGLAEILLREPKIAFLDEPTLGLDPEATQRILAIITALARERRTTVVLCSHFLHQVERICSRIGIMIGGKLVAQGSLGELQEAKFGIGSESYTLEEIYMKYFKDGEG
jgi:ABC-2 type transport system ATP-binding protein